MPFFAKPKPPPAPEKKKKKKKRGGVVIAGAIVALIAAATGNAPTTATLTSIDTSGSRTNGENAALAGSPTSAWRSLGLTRIGATGQQATKCASRATGQVRAFFLRAPCESLRMELVALRDDSENVIVVSIFWVRMSSPVNAAKLRAVEDTYGTGDITPISTRTLGLPTVRFSATHFGSRLAGSQLTVAEAEAASGQPTARQLDDVATVTAYLPAA